jgi:urease accessory protein
MTIRPLFAAAALLALPSMALAHPGHTHDPGFTAGALHVFTGIDHLLGLTIAGLLLGWLPTAARWPVLAGFLALLGVTHVWWLGPGAMGGTFIAGLMLTSTLLVAAGMATTRWIRFTAGAARSRI